MGAKGSVRMSRSRQAARADARKSKDELIEELGSLRQHLSELEGTGESERKGSSDPPAQELQHFDRAMPIGLCYFDRNLRYLLINDWLAALNGIPVENHLGRRINEVVPAIAAGVESQLRRVINTGKPIVGGTVDAETPAYPGLTRTFRHDYFPVESAEGAVIGVGCIVEENTKHKRRKFALDQLAAAIKGFNGAVLGITHGVKETIAEELARSEERLRQAAELAGLGHWVWDAVEDRCLYCSEEHARIHGVSVEEYIERASTLEGRLSFVHPEDREDVQDLFNALRIGEGFEAEYSHVTREGETRFVRVTAKPVFDQTDTVIQAYGTIQDITEHKRLERQHIHAEKMEALGVLSAGIAHEFNNVLFAIISLTESAANLLPEGNEARTCLEGVLEAGERAGDLVRQILVFGRQDEPQLCVLDLQDTVASALTLVRACLPTTIEIHQSLDTACGSVMVDPTHIHQILLNLASNAADAMREKGGLLDVRLDRVNADDRLMARWPQLAPGPYARLTVRDTGCGIDDRILGRIFDPFFTTKDRDTGTGMGLAAVHGIVSSYRGAIDVSSKLGRGSTFDIYLPIWAGEDGEDPRGDATRPEGPTRTI